jgi:site-specific recombinase XerD
MAKIKVSDVESSAIEESLRKLPPAHLNLHLRVLRAAFNYAVKKRWVTENPVKSLDFASEGKRKEVEVLSIRATRGGGSCFASAGAKVD